MKISNTALITGGNGFIGLNLINSIMNKYSKILITDKDISKLVEFKKLYDFSNKLEIFRGDVSNENFIESLFLRKPTHVYHLAAFFANQNSVDHPEIDLDVNGKGTLNILKKSTNNNVKKLFYASSSCVYGNVKNMNENIIGNLDTPYAITKLLGEYYCKFFSEHYGLNIVIFRIFNTYGIHDYPGIYRNVIPNFFHQAINSNPLKIYGDGSETRSFLYIDDLIALINLSMKKKYKNKIEIFNAGNTKSTKISTLAKKIIKISKSNSDILNIEKRSWDKIPFRKPNLQKTLDCFKWRPETKLDFGLNSYYQWYLRKVLRKKA